MKEKSKNELEKIVKEDLIIFYESLDELSEQLVKDFKDSGYNVIKFPSTRCPVPRVQYCGMSFYGYYQILTSFFNYKKEDFLNYQNLM